MAINSRSIRELADSLFELDRRLTGIERTPQMGHTSLEDIGLNVYDAEGNRTAVIGKQDDGSFGHRVIEGPTPAAPSGITTEPGTGNFLVSWDGTFAGGVEPPRDFSIVAIHASATPDFIPMPENTVATFSVAEAATRVVPLRTGSYYVSATTLSLAGKRSVPTDEVQAESAPLVDEQSIRDALDQARTEREEAAQEAQEALTELEGKLGELTGDSGELQTIRDAVAAAQQAVASAQTTASEAVTAANAASQAALEAAGIAASKGRVIVQETEPQGEDRKSSNIWIQPVPDDPDTEVEEKAVTYVYLEASDEWQPTTSSELAQAAQNALDAREQAQQAQQRADTAIANAADALTAAQTAKTTADGKNTLRFSLSEPTTSTPGQRSGDTWWRANTEGNIIGQWTWDGAQWVSVQLRSEVIANLDVSKLSVHDSAQISEAVIGRLFADIFTAHKITAEQIIVGGLPSEALADGAVGAVKIADGAVLADKLAADSVLADKIKAGEIATGHMQANSIDGDRIRVNSLSGDKITANTINAEKISGGSFSGVTFQGGTFIGSVFATNQRPSTDGGLSINQPNGLRAWNSSGKQTVSIDPVNGDLRMGAGVYLTDSSRNGLVLNPPSAIGTSSIYFTKGEDMGANSAAIWRLGYDTGRNPLMLRGANGEGITVKGETGTSFIEGNLEVGGQSVTHSRAFFRNWINYDNPPGSGVSNANLYLNPTNGIIARMTSSRKYKKNIQDWSADADAVMKLRPRTWQAVNPMEGDDPEAWFIGFVAEEVDELGLSHLVQYDENGNPDALHYATFSVVQQTVLQKHEEQISELEAENSELKARLEALEAKVAVL